MDELTIEAARKGDRPAQGRLLQDLQDTWFRYCLSQLRDADLARDAVQETALRFLRQLPGFRGESQLRTWSLGIALNVVRETRRKRKAQQLDLDDDENPVAATPRVARLPESENVGAGIEQQEQISMLKRTLDALPERQREAIVLRFFEDLSVEQTAAAMHCAAGTVKATVHQALRTLRDRMKLTS